MLHNNKAAFTDTEGHDAYMAVTSSHWDEGELGQEIHDHAVP